VAAPAFGASFDCGKTITAAEELICKDRLLSERDTEMSRLYKKSLAALSDAGRQALVADQRAWLQFRTKACPLPNLTQENERKIAQRCLLHLYFSRIGDLKQTGVKIGPYVFTSIVRYEATAPAPIDDDHTGTTGNGIVIRTSAIPRIDSPITPITTQWNAMNVRKNSGGDCDGNGGGVYDQSQGYGIAFANTRLISVVWTSFFYCHEAAHGHADSWTETQVLVPKPHSLQETDLFRSDRAWPDRLTKLVTEAVHKAYVDQFKSEPGAIEQKDISDVALDSKRWLMGANGLSVVFNSYELGQGYPFAPTVTIPWSKLRDLMAPDAPVF
jgi:uncharacterized protein YecT (DUF1311 family)